MYQDEREETAFYDALACVLVFLPLFAAVAVCFNVARAIGESIRDLFASTTRRTVTADNDVADQVISISDAIRSRIASEPLADSSARKAA